ncbi:MAG: hypothetical protein COU82_00595 [Candidatus Portnoybacteria bacterium CG10_big_fil_rev_8_21_14_0_10_38_18]|uniref:Uncharacterized protein n=1 Tax=Candidatus Portnoybacteria bacterium CG10_big_fil_rev_8_21_14_0_10_38_18 TaxID=1974813 RepID=A0A2M8KCQ0_9BACT|nr:MAG: hypothetical protein COU82_00595 [Candidatus Portnoybacteria bacterium CG10_big_fil_rev_8_21_14_0_10_38_18]
MKKDFGWIVIIVFIMGLIFGAVVGAYLMNKYIDHQAQKEVEQTQIYPTGSFTLTFQVNEDVMNLEAKEATTILMEQFVMALAEAESSYRYDGRIEHIKILGARLTGDREEAARLKFWLERGFIPRLSDKD